MGRGPWSPPEAAAVEPSQPMAGRGGSQPCPTSCTHWSIRLSGMVVQLLVMVL